MARRDLSPTTGPHTHPADPTTGPGFGRSSPIRVHSSEPALFLGAQRALLMQIAHPVIAQGVDDHSTFRQLPMTRLLATADAMICMVWGTDAQAVAAHQGVMAIHDRVNGTMPPPESGPAYTAHDPDALCWVWGTLVETTYQVHQRWLRPVGAAWQGVYEDWRRFGAWFGLPQTELPTDPESFRPWYAHRLHQLVVTDEARDVARSIIDPPLWFVPKSVKRAHALVATGLLDPVLREQYGLAWDRRTAAAFERAERRLRATHAAVPTFRRLAPPVYIRARQALIPS